MIFPHKETFLDTLLNARLKHGRKTVFLAPRRFLPPNPFRKLKQALDGNTEDRGPPRILSGEDVYEMINNVNEVLGIRKRSSSSLYEICEATPQQT